MKLTKRIISVILTVLLVCQIGAVAFAYDTDSVDPYEPKYYIFNKEIENDEFVYLVNEKEKIAQVARIKNQDYTGKDLVIPKEIDGHKIVYISPYFDADLCSDGGYIGTVTSIIIEAELTDAVSYEYYYWYDHDGNGAITYGFFEHFVNLKSIKLPDSLRIINEGMFNNCKKLEHVELPENLECIDDYAFENCESLKDIVFKNNLKEIRVDAFANCNSLTNVIFNDKLENVYGAFRNCKNLTNVVLNANLKSIGSCTFQGCEKLISVDSNNDLKIELGDNLERIGSEAFSGCVSLKEKIYLGEKVSYIGKGAFAYCHGITGFRIAEGNENFSQKSGVLYNKDQTKIICYSAGKGTEKWSVPSTVKEIERHAFAGTENLKKVTLPSSFEIIGQEVFIGSGLESFSFPKNVKHISWRAFENCKNLKKVKFNSKLETISRYAFSGCTKLEGKMEIGKNVNSISSDAFLYCDSLTGFRIADGNKHFSQKSGVLYNKDKSMLISYLSGKKTEHFKIPTTVRRIWPYSFAGSKYLKEITFPSKFNTKIPDYAFYKSSVRTVTVPATYLAPYCFANSKVSNVNLESSKREMEIAKYAFLNCDNLKSITIPEQATVVDTTAFYDCDNLTKIKVMRSGLICHCDKDDDSRLNRDLVIYGKKKSDAESWAKEINRPFKII